MDSTPAWLPRRRWLLIALACWLLATVGLRPLMLPDEGRYVGVAWAMLQGDWWTPRLHGLPYFHKPPLMYWIDAAAFSVFGPNEAAARLAPALGAWIMAASIHADLYRRVGARDAAIALVVIATCPFFFVGGQFANLDMLVAGWITLAIIAAARAADAVEAGEPKVRRWAVAAWGAAGAAVLAKGLIGLVLPALVLLPWLAMQRRWRALGRLIDPLGLLAFAALVLPWFVVMTLRHPGFLEYFFVEQHFRRYAQAGFNNPQPFWFFYVALPLLMLPWSLWLAAYARRTWRPATAPWALYAWWCVIVLLFFSLPRSKLVGYALPALGPAAALAGLAAARGRSWRVVAAATAVACLAVVLFLGRYEKGSNRDVAIGLRERAGSGDRVVLVGGPYFDLLFYARLSGPPWLVEQWDDPTIAQHDDWRKEIADAARFAPDAASRRLVRPAELAARLEAPGVTWLVTPTGWQPPASLGALERVQQGANAALWRRASPERSP